MLTGTRVVLVNAPIVTVHALLADLTVVDRWNPRISRARRESGDGGPGTTYTCTVSLLRRHTPMSYTVTSFDAPRGVTWLGHGEHVTTTDVFSLSHHPRGLTVVEWEAGVVHHTLPRVGQRLLAPPLHRLYDEVCRSLRAVAHDQPAGAP